MAPILASDSHRLGGQQLSTFFCGDDEGAKATVAALLFDLDVDPVDAGPLTSARYIEPAGMLAVQLAYGMGRGPNVGTKFRTNEPETRNIAAVRRLYEARGNPEIIHKVLAPDARWEVVEGFPFSDVYLGPDDVLGRFFGRLFGDFEDWHTEPSEFFETDNRVIALGTYSARAKATGRMFKARFAHVWTMRDGVIVRLQHCADTAQLARALEPK